VVSDRNLMYVHMLDIPTVERYCYLFRGKKTLKESVERDIRAAKNVRL